MPLSNKTPPSLDSHRENSQTIITTLYTFSLIWSTVTLDRIFSCLIYHFALNEVFVMLCNIYASVFPSENFIMYVIYLGHIYLQSSILNSPTYICPPLILSQLHVLLVFCCFFVLFCFQLSVLCFSTYVIFTTQLKYNEMPQSHTCTIYGPEFERVSPLSISNASFYASIYLRIS